MIPGNSASTAIKNRQQTISIYPNPASEQIYIQQKGNANLGNFRLVNAIGQALYFGYPSNPTAPIEIGHLPKGMYKLVWENPLLESQTLILQ